MAGKRWLLWAAAIAVATGSALVYPPGELRAEGGYIVGLESYPLRDNPQFSDPAVSRVHTGDRVNVLERRAGWVRVKVRDRNGWVIESIVGGDPPPGLEIAPLKKKLEELEAQRAGAAEGEKERRLETERLKERVKAQQKELGRLRTAIDESSSRHRLWGMALGGALVLFGWITGYALAARSRAGRKGRKYQLE